MPRLRHLLRHRGVVLEPRAGDSLARPERVVGLSHPFNQECRVSITLHPLGAQVLVRLIPLPERTGSIIRVSRNEYARQAEVLAVGPECRDVTEGSVVLVGSLAGQQVGDDLLIPETAVLAYVED